jgi:hypothetical protein
VFVCVGGQTITDVIIITHVGQTNFSSTKISALLIGRESFCRLRVKKPRATKHTTTTHTTFLLQIAFLKTTPTIAFTIFSIEESLVR